MLWLIEPRLVLNYKQAGKGEKARITITIICFVAISVCQTGRKIRARQEKKLFMSRGNDAIFMD